MDQNNQKSGVEAIREAAEAVAASWKETASVVDAAVSAARKATPVTLVELLMEGADDARVGKARREIMAETVGNMMIDAARTSDSAHAARLRKLAEWLACLCAEEVNRARLRQLGIWQKQCASILASAGLSADEAEAMRNELKAQLDAATDPAVGQKMIDLYAAWRAKSNDEGK
jgi:flagellin-specific chaperone FliS